jgi:hypothetical protein
MISKNSALQIRKSIPDIVQRARMGEQNALAYLVEINKHRKLNQRSSFAYDVALSYIKGNPKTESGIVTINGEEDDYLNQLSPLACAIVIIPKLDTVDFSRISNMPLVLKYIISLISARAEDFHSFPMINGES